MPATFSELLAPTKSEPNGALTWVPVRDDARPFLAGLLTISGRRSHVRYAVEETSSGMAARLFVLKKLDPGTDRSEGHYSCLTSAGGLGVECDCKGFVATSARGAGHCKHLSALQTLLANGQL